MNNVILIVADSLRHDHYNLIKAFDKRFGDFSIEHAYANSNWTLPSILSMFTGRYQFENHIATGKSPGINDLFFKDIKLDYSLLGEAVKLKKIGLSTVPWVRKGTCLYGFDEVHDIWKDVELYSLAYKLFANKVHRIPKIALNLIYGLPVSVADPIYLHFKRIADMLVYRDSLDYGAEKLNTQAIKAVKGSRNKKLFLYLHYLEPHEYYPYVNMMHNKWIYMSGILPIDKRLASQLKRGYEARVKYLNEKLAELLEEFERLNILDDSLIIFTADHGQDLGENGLLFHGRGESENLINVPLFAYANGFEKQHKGYFELRRLNNLITDYAKNGKADINRYFNSYAFSEGYGRGTADHIDMSLVANKKSKIYHKINDAISKLDSYTFAYLHNNYKLVGQKKNMMLNFSLYRNGREVEDNEIKNDLVEKYRKLISY
ncbi:MAG: sulfatase-like hydrolase/transferase [Candidatus Micrarchaeia archaeon]